MHGGSAAPPPPPPAAGSRPGAAASRRLALYLPLGLCLLTLAGFLPVLGNGFVDFDDPQYVFANPHVRQGLSGAGLRWALTAQVGGNWHPLTLASHMLDVQLFGLNPKGHHLTSLLLHLANVLLLFAVLRRMTGSRLRSAAVAALFAVHPLHVESVAWVAERKDLLCGLFWMLSLAAYLRYSRAPSAGRYLLVAAAFSASLMAKAMAVSLPLVLLLLDWWPLDRWQGWRRREPGGGRQPGPRARRVRQALWLAAEKLPLLCLAAAGGAIAMRTQAEPLASGGGAPLALRLANALTSYFAYLGKFLDPRHLGVFYPFEAVPASRAIAAALSLVAITVLAGLAARRAPYLIVGWLWYLVTLAPVIGVLQVGWQGLADRYTYLPSIGLFVAVVWGIADLAAVGRSADGSAVRGIARPGEIRDVADPAAVAGAGRARHPVQPIPSRWGARLLEGAGVAAVALILLALTAATRRQVRTWSDSFTLFSHSLAVQESYLAHTNIAEALRARGDQAGALAHYRAAVRLAPRSPRAHAALGDALRSWGHPAAALQPLRAALELDPADERSRLLLAMTLDDLGQSRLAVAQLRLVLASHPDSIDAHLGLADLLQRTGEPVEAAAHRRRAEALAAGRQAPR
ncbi:MAG TPA: tetratricopeptide repeat protein [Thermoanaerobaculia bacterium]|nr:tetratricopeptide repeat protein [Thermoanaerobaculia bacterium]